MIRGWKDSNKEIKIQDIQKCIAGNGWSFDNEILGRRDIVLN